MGGVCEVEEGGMYMLIPPRGVKCLCVEAPAYAPLISFGTTKQLTVWLPHKHSIIANTHTDDELKGAMIAVDMIDVIAWLDLIVE